MKKSLAWSLLLLFTLFSVEAVIAQVRSLTPTPAPLLSNRDVDGAEFYFTRLIYSADRSGFRGGGSWTTDIDTAEHFMMEGLNRLTRVDGSSVALRTLEGARQLALTDEALFDSPWLYGVEVGTWSLNAQETANLREYLLRGGFLMVDDFHGTYEWQGFVEDMQRVFPDRPIVDIPPDDEIFNVVYELDLTLQIAGLGALQRGVTYEDDGYEPVWRGIYDDDGRLMVIINHNMDLGDAWEHADTPGYPEPMTAAAYRFAVNYVIYSMTH